MDTDNFNDDDLPNVLSEEKLEDLLNKALRGNKTALGILFEHERENLRRRANKFPSSHITSIVHMTMFQASINLESLRNKSIAGFRAWIFVIYRRKVWAETRKVKSVQFTLATDAILSLSDPWPTVDEQVMMDEREVDLHNRINALGDDQRQAIWMHYFEGLPVESVAVNLDKSEKAVYGLLDRARKKLRMNSNDEDIA